MGPTVSLPDRMIAILLIGAAIETTLAVVLGREVRNFEASVEEVGKDLQLPLTFAREGKAAWRARTALQHSGIVPDADGCADVVNGADMFVRELVQRVYGVPLESVSMASGVSTKSVCDALTNAERNLGDGDLVAAAAWSARALERITSMAKSGTRQLFKWADAERAFERLDGDLVRWLRELREELAELALARTTGIAAEEWVRLGQVLPWCFTNLNGEEKVVWREGYTPDETAVRWACNRLIIAATSVEEALPERVLARQVEPLVLEEEGARPLF